MGFKNDNQRKAVMATLNNGASTRQNTKSSTLSKIKSTTKNGWVSTKDGKLGVSITNTGVISISALKPFASSSIERDDVNVRLDELEHLIRKAKGIKTSSGRGVDVTRMHPNRRKLLIAELEKENAIVRETTGNMRNILEVDMDNVNFEKVDKILEKYNLG